MYNLGVKVTGINKGELRLDYSHFCDSPSFRVMKLSATFSDKDGTYGIEWGDNLSEFSYNGKHVKRKWDME